MAHRYESDRSFKEKMLLEKEKLSNMTWRERAEYIWAYYKPVFAALVILIFIIAAGVEVYQNSLKVDVLNIGAVNSFVEDGAEGMEQQLLEILGTGDPYEVLSVDCTYTLGDSIENADPNVLTKFMAILAAGDMDVLICNDFVVDYYSQDSFMMDLSELFTAEECEKYGIKKGDTSIDITHLPTYEQFGLTRYENCKLVVISSGKNLDNAVRFIKYLEEGDING